MTAGQTATTAAARQSFWLMVCPYLGPLRHSRTHQQPGFAPQHGLWGLYRYANSSASISRSIRSGADGSQPTFRTGLCLKPPERRCRRILLQFPYIRRLAKRCVPILELERYEYTASPTFACQGEQNLEAVIVRNIKTCFAGLRKYARAIRPKRTSC
jgi:hypothetical protein